MKPLRPSLTTFLDCNLLRSAVCLLAVLWTGGCAVVSVWRAPAEVRAPDRSVATALGDAYRGATPRFDPSSIPLPPEPTNLRPCCAFGTDLRVAVGAVPIPGFTLSNLRGPEELGPHKYNVGMLALGSSDANGNFERENNGLVYTCRGGFLDIAHIRDCADMTVYLTAQISRNIDAGATVELAEQGGKRRILLAAVDKDRIANIGRRAATVALAQWLAFQVSIWHEIATWYGYASAASWPEKVSAFSPEDLYSNLIGIKLAGGINLLRENNDEASYNKAMDAWIAMALQRLRAVSKTSATEAMQSVAGIWWDPTRRLPDWQLVLRRRFDAGLLLKPWVVSMAFAPGSVPYAGCANAGPWLALNNPDSFEGVPFAEDADLEIDVSDELAANGFPFPRKDSHRITQADFPAIIAAIRRENAAAFGTGADQPKK